MSGKPPSDRLPPHAPDVEAAVLGCLLWSPDTGLIACDERGVNSDWFYELRHKTIYGTLQTLAAAGVAIDLVTVANELGSIGALEKCGGLAYLSALQDKTPGASMLDHYLNILQGEYQRRMILRLAADATLRAYDSQDDPAQILPDLERDVLALGEARCAKAERPIKPLMLETIDRMEKYHRGQAQIVGLTTGLEYLDKLVCGIGGDNGQMFVLAARPGMGKTSFALDVVAHVALDYTWHLPKLDPDGNPVLTDGQPEWEEHRGIPVGIFSMEMTAQSLVHRLLFSRAQADMQRWRTGFGRAEDMPRLVTASSALAKAQIYIDDTRRQTIGEVKAKARRWVRAYGVRFFVLDYIQLMRADHRRFRDDRVQELMEISGELQALSSGLGVPFFILAQMNRDYEKDPNRKPRLSDLKDCGAIEQDADVVAFLYEARMKPGDPEHDTYTAAVEAVHGKDWSQYPSRVDLLVAKNRYGPTGNCKLLFQRSCTHFLDWVVWLKTHNQKELAAGERPSSLEPADETDLPTNQDLGLDK